MPQPYDGLRSFLDECEAHGEVTVIKDADWNLEIGALTETASELIDEPPALMFDEIKGYPKGFRVLIIPTASRRRMALALGLPPDTPKMEIVRHAASRIKHAAADPAEGGRDRPGDAERHARQRGRSVPLPGAAVAPRRRRTLYRHRRLPSSTAIPRPATSTWAPTGCRCTSATCSASGRARASRGARSRSATGSRARPARWSRRSAAIRCCSSSPTRNFRSACPSSIAPAACSAGRSR